VVVTPGVAHFKGDLVVLGDAPPTSDIADVHRFFSMSHRHSTCRDVCSLLPNHSIDFGEYVALVGPGFDRVDSARAGQVEDAACMAVVVEFLRAFD